MVPTLPRRAGAGSGPGPPALSGRGRGAAASRSRPRPAIRKAIATSRPVAGGVHEGGRPRGPGDAVEQDRAHDGDPDRHRQLAARTRAAPRPSRAAGARPRPGSRRTSARTPSPIPKPVTASGAARSQAVSPPPTWCSTTTVMASPSAITVTPMCIVVRPRRSSSIEEVIDPPTARTGIATVAMPQASGLSPRPDLQHHAERQQHPAHRADEAEHDGQPGHVGAAAQDRGLHQR